MALKKKHKSKPEAVSVTASTGMAASNIGGITSRIRTNRGHVLLITHRGRHDATLVGRDRALCRQR